MDLYAYDRRAEDLTAAEEAVNPEDEKFGELDVAEYAVFLFALDTYLRYLEETTGDRNSTDDVANRGIRLLRMAENQHLDTIKLFFHDHLTNTTHQRMVDRGFGFRPNLEGIARRALQVRSALNRGGVTRTVFKEQRPYAEMKSALSAAMTENADLALDKFAAINLRNVRLRDWIRLAAKTAGSGKPPDIVAEATEGVGEAAKQVTEHAMAAQGAPASETGVRAGEAKGLLMEKVQVEAQATAEQALAHAGRTDEPPKRSEVVAIATAAAVAATSDPTNSRNVPPSLARLSDENRAVALMGGRVRVAAGAGAGKSTTLCARVNYLIEEQHVQPESILVTSFNVKAKDDLLAKITAGSGAENASKMTIGTMHGIFLKFIMRYGTPAEKAMFLARSADPKGGTKTGIHIMKDGQVMRAVFKAWNVCFPQPEDTDPPLPVERLWRLAPKPKRMKAYMNKFQGSGWDLKQVQDWARASREPEHIQAAVFFEFYEGFKGAFGPTWQPRACPTVTKTKAYEDFSRRGRSGAARSGDFQDMLTVFRNLMRNNPQARKALQDQYDNIFIDECQDLNPVQTEAFLSMAEGIETNDKKKSIWMVGDDKQSIYAFRGSDPALFRGLDQHGFKTGYMRTNRRSLPEIVETANRLIAHNVDQIPMEAVPLEGKPRGVASIVVSTPPDNPGAAVIFGDKVKNAQLNGDKLEDYAVLARTNAELHDYETACIIRGVPYVRKGASSFLGSPESQTFLSFIDATTASEPTRLQGALAHVLHSTAKIPLGGKKPEEVEAAVDMAVQRFCQKNGSNPKDLNPIVALMKEPTFRDEIVRAMGGGKDVPDWKLDKDGNELRDLADAIVELRTKASEEGYTTQQMFEDILATPTTERVLDESGKWSTQEVTLKEKIVKQLKMADLDKEDDGDVEDEVEDEPLGTLAFFNEMLKPDPLEPDIDPSKPGDFRVRIDRYKQRAKELRYDPEKWEKEHGSGSKPPAVYLGTVHSVKGAEWKDVTVLMPVGVFPFQKRGMGRRDGKQEVPEVPLFSPEQEMESERRLGYVALTRAVQDLTVLCPREAVNRGRPRVPGMPPPPPEAALSPFVIEAGLRIGENVTPPAATGSSVNAINAQADADTTPSIPKTAEDGYDYSRFIACDVTDPLGSDDDAVDAWRE